MAENPHKSNNTKNGSDQTPRLPPTLRNGELETEPPADDIQLVNGYGELARNADNFRYLSDDEDDAKGVQFNPNQNGLRVVPHNLGNNTNTGAIPKCPVFKNLKKQFQIEKHTDFLNSNHSIKNSVVPKTKHCHNPACCDIFCGQATCRNDKESEAECAQSDVYCDTLETTWGWNDVNGGGVSGCINPSLLLSPDTENGLRRNFVSAENLNLSESDDPEINGHVSCAEADGRVSHDLSERQLSNGQMSRDGSVRQISRNPSNGQISREISDERLSEMVDEGAVCDFDKLQLQEFEELYGMENLDIDNDCVSDEFESPDILFPYLESGGREIGESSHSNNPYKQKSYLNHFNGNEINYQGEVGASAQPVSVTCYRTVRCEDHVVQDPNTEDNGDFIDTDLPSKASGPNSSESFSESDEDLTRQPYDSSGPDNPNDLSGPRNSINSSSIFRDNTSSPVRENCYHSNKGSNFDTNKDESLYPVDKLHLLANEDCDNSSESENGDTVSDVQFNSQDFGGHCDDLDSNDHMTSNQSLGAVGNFRRTCYEEYVDDHGVSASGSSAVSCEKVSNSPDLPICNCPSINSLCFAQSSSGWSRVNNLSCGSQNSNLQNDESNKKPKIFNKFPMLPGEQCGSQAAQNLVGCNHLSHDQQANLPFLTSSGSDQSLDLQSPRQQARMLYLASNCIQADHIGRVERVSSFSECGVSEPIYEDIRECDLEDQGKTGASSGFTESFKNNIDSEPKQKKTSRKSRKLMSTSGSSSGNRGLVQNVMIWSEQEAEVQQVNQIGTSACGPTAVINVLKALDYNINKEEVSRVIRAKLRMEDAPIPLYLFSRAVAGTEASDLLQGVETLTHGKLRGRFFKFWPPRDVHLVKWLGSWMKKGAVPLATLNLQKGLIPNQPIPDAWHHQMIFGVSSRDIFLTNPKQRVAEEIILEQLTSDSVLLVTRNDVIKRYRDGSDLRDLLIQSDERWCTMNLLGQVINVLREESLVNVPGYRTQLTSHVTIPSVYETGITFFVHSNSDTWTELKSANELPYSSGESNSTGIPHQSKSVEDSSYSPGESPTSSGISPSSSGISRTSSVESPTCRDFPVFKDK